MNSIFITFIIPTIGRDCLYNSINSLLQQDDNNWKAIIIGDGVENIEFSDNRIKFIEMKNIDKKSCGSAGLVRNYGFHFLENTEWIAFLDDDDTLSKDYISKLKEEIKLNPTLDVCIFRMGYKNGCILPHKSVRNIIIGKMGISFAIKKNISEKIKFQNIKCEDFFYLKDLQKNNYKIVISSYVTYFVRTAYYETELYPRILINFK